MRVYDYTATNLDGSEAPLSAYKGDVLLVVTLRPGVDLPRNTKTSRKYMQTIAQKGLKSSTFHATSSASKHLAAMKRSINSVR